MADPFKEAMGRAMEPEPEEESRGKNPLAAKYIPCTILAAGESITLSNITAAELNIQNMALENKARLVRYVAGRVKNLSTDFLSLEEPAEQPQTADAAIMPPVR